MQMGKVSEITYKRSVKKKLSSDLVVKLAPGECKVFICK